MNPDARAALAAIAAAQAGVHTLATVVAVTGSSYRRPGARLLVHASGAVAGSVSGGCLEGTIIRRGRWWAEAGPVIRRFTTDADPDDDDAAAPGCGGTIDVLVEHARADDAGGPLAVLAWVRARRAAACVATVIGGDALPLAARCAWTADAAWAGAHGDAFAAACARDARRVIADGRSAWRRYDLGGRAAHVFLEHVPAPRELLVVGRHHDVAPVVRIARLAGWEVTVAATGVAAGALGDPDAVIALDAGEVAAWARARPAPSVVIMTHSLALDRAIVGALAAGPAPAYLGVLGPRNRTDSLVRDLDAPSRVRAVLRTPVGLDLGGDGPEAIALSIVAELQATWHGRSAASLHARDLAAAPRLASVP